MLALKTKTLHLVNRGRAFGHMAYRVQRGAITAPTDAVHPEHRVECTWTIHAPEFQSRRHYGSAVPSSLQKLKIGTPGLTLIRVKPELPELLGPHVVAQIRVLSNAAEVLNSVRVTPKWPFRTLLEFRTQSSKGDLTGSMVTEVNLPHAGALRNLAVIGYGDVVVDPETLLQDTGVNPTRDFRDRMRGRRRRGGCGDNAVLLVAAGDSRLFLDDPSTSMKFDTLKIATVGNSQAMLNLKGLEIARTLEVGTAGGSEGQTAVLVDTLITPRLGVGSVGSGYTNIYARGHLEATEIKVSTVGTGCVHVDALTPVDSTSSPLCFRQKVNLVGTGMVDLGAVQTQHADVKVLGSSDVRVRPRDSLRFTNVGNGILECVGRVPPVHKISGFPSPTIMETPVNDPERAKSTHKPTMPTRPTVKEVFSHPVSLETPWYMRSRSY